MINFWYFPKHAKHMPSMMGFLPLPKRIMKVLPGLEVARSPSSHGSIAVPMAAQVGLPSFEIT